MDLELLNKLYLELSQVCTATTNSEMKLMEKIKKLEDENARLRGNNIQIVSNIEKYIGTPQWESREQGIGG